MFRTVGNPSVFQTTPLLTHQPPSVLFKVCKDYPLLQGDTSPILGFTILTLTFTSTSVFALDLTPPSSISLSEFVHVIDCLIGEYCMSDYGPPLHTVRLTSVVHSGRGGRLPRPIVSDEIRWTYRRLGSSVEPIIALRDVDGGVTYPDPSSLSFLNPTS